MITGKVRYLVAEVDAVGDTHYWGPFDDKETAVQWEGMPNGNGSAYSVEPIRSAPPWYPGVTPEEEQSDEGGTLRHHRAARVAVRVPGAPRLPASGARHAGPVRVGR